MKTTLSLARSKTRRTMAGVSLVELMVAMALGLLVLAGLASLFANSSASRTEMERNSRQIENGRFAIELLSDDLRLAGFYGDLAVQGLSPPAGPPAPPPNPCSTIPADWNNAMLMHVQGYDNGMGVPTCVPGSLKPNTDVLVIRRVDTCETGKPGCPIVPANNVPYIQVARCATETIGLTRYILGTQGTTPFTLHERNCATLAGQRQYYVRIYFISRDNGLGAPIPTLKRMDFDGTGFTETALVEGIEELNLEYGIDDDGDGSAERYLAAPATIADWTNVVTVRIHLLARNIEESVNYRDNKQYRLGRDAMGGEIVIAPVELGYRRHAYSGLVRVVNAAERRDLP